MLHSSIMPRDMVTKLTLRLTHPFECKIVTYSPLVIPKIKRPSHSPSDLVRLDKFLSFKAHAFKTLLAHQEHMSDIENFILKFCANWISLNSVTCVVTHPVPRCDNAVGTSFGGPRFSLYRTPLY